MSNQFFNQILTLDYENILIDENGVNFLENMISNFETEYIKI
jgi:hypothetical protein